MILTEDLIPVYSQKTNVRDTACILKHMNIRPCRYSILVITKEISKTFTIFRKLFLDFNLFLIKIE